MNFLWTVCSVSCMSHFDSARRALNASRTSTHHISTSYRTVAKFVAGLWSLAKNDWNKRWVGPEGYKGMVARQLQEFKKMQRQRSERALAALDEDGRT